MDEPRKGPEFCAICGKDADGGRWFCHFYRTEGRDTFCSPACAEVFLHRPAEPGGGQRARPAVDGFDVTRLVLN